MAVWTSVQDGRSIRVYALRSTNKSDAGGRILTFVCDTSHTMPLNRSAGSLFVVLAGSWSFLVLSTEINICINNAR